MRLSPESPFVAAVLDVVDAIPAGHVMTYGDVAVLRLADVDEADAVEERLRTRLARLPHHRDALHAALQSLLGQRLRREATDTLALRVGVDVDAPDACAEFLVLIVRIEVAVDEPDDLVVLQDDALPGAARNEHRGLGRV